MLGQQLGPRIRAKRLEWGMSYSGAGKYLGVNERTVRGWEQETYFVGVRHLPVVLAWLEAPITDRPKSARSADTAEARSIVEHMTREHNRLGITQRELAEILGVSHAQISTWRRRICMPSPDSLRVIVHWLERVQKDEEIAPTA